MAFAAALAWALLGLPLAAVANEAVVLQLSGPAQFEFAGYYAALWQGFYRDAGLDVSIRPSGLKPQTVLDPVREVTEGRAQFGTGTMQLVIRRAQGLPVVLLAPIFQQSGAAIYYRADSDFSSPAGLINARLGRLPASDILDIELTTALRGEGIDPTRIKAVTVEANQIVAALADRTIDAAMGSAWITPWQAHERGIALKSFNPANYRVEYYGDSLFTIQRFAAAAPQTVARFRSASLKGWEYALQHPDSMMAKLAAEKSSEPPAADLNGLNRYQADVAHRLSRYPDIPLGYSNLDRWTQIEAGMVGAGALQHAAKLSDFVYDPGEEPVEAAGGGLARLLAAIVVAVVAFGAAVWFSLLFWRRRAVARAREPAVAPPTAGLPSVTAAVAAVFKPQLSQSPVAIPRPAPTAPAAEPPAPRPKPAIDLNAVLAPLERRIRQRLRGKARLRFSLLPELWPCRADGAAVTAAVMDLVEAATNAMGADGA
ncbi:MAG: ABC transporter substrate-binding protein, partial [Alphaproteobacteria bacterium]|nr:ABC transporter substrate-binding protein [Alphaproteobacteria bacterium]